jgi:hypothetical protein
MTAGVLILRLLQRGDPASLARDAAGLLLSATVSVGLLVAILAAWRLTGPIDDLWRRGVASGMAVFGTVLLTLLAAPLDTIAGVAGLAGYLLVLAVAGTHFARLARRAGAA